MAARATHRSPPTNKTFAVLACAMLALACHDAAAPPQLRLDVTGGAFQHAPAGALLPADVIVRLHDAAGDPVAGVTVTWRPATGSGDEILPLNVATDRLGLARASWRLDSIPGNHRLTISAAGAPPALAEAIADSVPVVLSTVHLLPLVSYDGSGQFVHPDLARVPDAWGSGVFRLAATPYPSSIQRFENPSLFAGSSLTAFDVPPGVQNPLVSPDSGYLSDPDMVFDPDDQMLSLYYRRVTAANEIWLIRSADGVNWSDPVLVAIAPSQMIVSPTVVRRGPGEWLMWSVNAGVEGCIGQSTTVELRRSADGVTWSDPEVVDLQESGRFAWHIDVEWIASRHEYWALYPVKAPGSCATASLRFATSADGVHWHTYPSPLLWHGALDAFEDIVYRASMDHGAPDGTVTMFYSGARLVDTSFAWSIAWEQLTDSALFARVNAAPSAAILAERSAPAAAAHPLTDATAP
jgi:hypothetical protein